MLILHFRNVYLNVARTGDNVAGRLKTGNRVAKRKIFTEMKNNFEDAMSKRTNEELIKIINSSSGDYQPEAVEAAEQEIKKRQFTIK